MLKSIKIFVGMLINKNVSRETTINGVKQYKKMVKIEAKHIKLILTRDSYLIFNNNGLETVRVPDRALELKIPVKNVKKRCFSTHFLP